MVRSPVAGLTLVSFCLSTCGCAVLNVIALVSTHMIGVGLRQVGWDGRPPLAGRWPVGGRRWTVERLEGRSLWEIDCPSVPFGNCSLKSLAELPMETSY